MTSDLPLPCSDISVLENEVWFSSTQQTHCEPLGGPGSVPGPEDTVRRRLSLAQRCSETTTETEERISDLTLAGKVALLACIKMQLTWMSSQSDYLKEKYSFWYRCSSVCWQITPSHVHINERFFLEVTASDIYTVLTHWDTIQMQEAERNTKITDCLSSSQSY